MAVRQEFRDLNPSLPEGYYYHRLQNAIIRPSGIAEGVFTSDTQFILPNLTGYSDIQIEYLKGITLGSTVWFSTINNKKFIINGVLKTEPFIITEKFLEQELPKIILKEDENVNISEQEQNQVTLKDAVHFQDEAIVNEAEKLKELSEPSITPKTTKLNPPDNIMQLEGEFTDKDFTGQPSTLEKEIKVTKAQKKQAMIVLGTFALIVGLVGTALYVMSKKKK